MVGCGTGYAVDNSGTSSIGSVRAMGRREPNFGLAIGASRWVTLAFVGRSPAAAVGAGAGADSSSLGLLCSDPPLTWPWLCGAPVLSSEAAVSWSLSRC